MEVHVILGGPGCNKTGLLTELYAKCVNQYGWDKVAFISYTVAQVRRDKSKVKSITKLSADKLDAFRTIHSAARQHYTEETVVIPEREFEGMSVFMDIDMTNIYKGIDYMRQLETKNMAVGANKAGLDTDNFKKCVYFYNKVKEKKSLNGIKVIDFSDMLKDAVDAHYKIDVDCAFIDECFAPNTKVRMADMSIKEIKDIKVGDFVMGTNGATKVTAVHKGTDTMYDVKALNGDLIFTCNSKHLIKQYTGYIIGEWRHAEDLCNDHTGVYIDRIHYATKQKARWAFVTVVPTCTKGEYVGLTVNAEDHLFVLANGAIVHNCQDLTPLQWRAIYTFFRDVKHLYVAGDPNQSLYRFNGGRPNYMLEMRYDDIKILNHSSRCSSNVMEMAFLVWKKMTNAAEMPISNGDTSGFGVFYPEKKLRNSFKMAIERSLNKGEKVLVLANTYFQLVKIRDDILNDDLSTPHNFYSGRCKYHYKDRKQNVITFSTVHQAKGAEADYVIYDVSYGRVYSDHEYGCVEDRWQDYYRMVYTGITRAKKGIILCECSPAVANEPSCKSFMFYSNYGLENYKKWLNAFLPSNTLTFDHLQLYSNK